MKFNYQARDKKGEIQSGTVEASSRESAILLLQRHGLYVTDIEQSDVVPFYVKKIKFFDKVSAKELVLFSRQLSILFKSDVSLIESLRVLAAQSKNHSFKEKVFTMVEDIEGGTSFSGALSRYPEIFSSFYVAMVKSGEASGRLSESLSYLAEHLEKKYHLISQIRGAMVYPALVTIVAVSVLVLMVVFVIPQLTSVLIETGGELPAITKAVISLSNFSRKWFWAITLFFIGAVVVFLRYYQSSAGKRFFDGFFLRFPLIGPLMKMIYLSRFAENLSTLISGGLPIASALETAGDIVGNTAYQEAILKTRDEVRKGESISVVLSDYSLIFPPMFTQMTLVGERTGTLDKSLMNLVDFYEKEVDRGINNILGILEPLLIVSLGLIVAGLMGAILLPMYQMTAIM